jgi:hypothetical protein
MGGHQEAASSGRSGINAAKRRWHSARSAASSYIQTTQHNKSIRFIYPGVVVVAARVENINSKIKTLGFKAI